MNKEKILLVGASGFAGHHVLQELSSKNVEVTTLSRKSLPDLPLNTKNYIFNFTDIDSYNEIPLADHLVMCLGSPLKLWDLVYLKKSDIPKFIALDKDCVINLAKAAKKIGIKKISIVSAVGANSQSFNTYLKTKGRVEEEIIAMNFESTNIFRPAHMCGRIDWEKSKNTYRFDVFIEDGDYVFRETHKVLYINLDLVSLEDKKKVIRFLKEKELLKSTYDAVQDLFKM